MRRIGIGILAKGVLVFLLTALSAGEESALDQDHVAREREVKRLLEEVSEGRSDDEALEVLSRRVEEQPDSVVIGYARADLLGRMGRWECQADELLRVLELGHVHETRLLELVPLLIRLDRLQPALGLYSLWHVSRPDEPAFAVRIAELHRRVGNVREGERRARAVVENREVSGEDRRAAAEVLIKAAIDLMDRALLEEAVATMRGIAPQAPDGLIELARLHAMDGEAEKAIALLEHWARVVGNPAASLRELEDRRFSGLWDHEAYWHMFRDLLTRAMEERHRTQHHLMQIEERRQAAEREAADSTVMPEAP